MCIYAWERMFVGERGERKPVPLPIIPIYLEINIFSNYKPGSCESLDGVNASNTHPDTQGPGPGFF